MGEAYSIHVRRPIKIPVKHTGAGRYWTYWKALTAFTLLSLAFLGGMWLNSYPIPNEKRIYDKHNWFHIYEDGSFVGETTIGYPVQGCIEGAICND